MEEGRWVECTEGTPQGATVSPLLANIYLHYAFDLWAQRWRTRCATGDVVFVRYADDLVAGFQNWGDAERFRCDLGERFAKFALELHPGKTRLLKFGRMTVSDPQAIVPDRSRKPSISWDSRISPRGLG